MCIWILRARTVCIQYLLARVLASSINRIQLVNRIHTGCSDANQVRREAIHLSCFLQELINVRASRTSELVNKKRGINLGFLKCGILKITRRLFRRCSTCAFAHTAQAPRATVASGAGSERERERTNMAHSKGGG